MQLNEEVKSQNEDQVFELTPSDLLDIISRRRLILLICCVLSLLGGIFLALRPRKFTADGTIRIQPGASSVYKTAASPMFFDSDPKVSAETRILQSRTLYMRVARELNLANDTAFWSKSHLPAQSLNDPLVRDKVLKLMVSKIKVVHEPKEEVVTITATTISPELSARIVNTLVNDYIEDLFQMRLGATQRTSNWLVGQLDDLKQQIEKDQASVIRLQTKLGIVGLDDKMTNSLTGDSLEAMTRASTEATMQRILAEARFRYLQEANPNLLEGELSVLSGAATANNPNSLLQTLRSRQADVSSNYAKLTAQFGENYPAVKQAKAQLNEINAEVSAEQSRIVNQAKLAYSAASANESMTVGALEKKKAEASHEQDDMVRYSILVHDYQAHRALYEGLVQRLREAGITSGLESNEIDIVDLADAPALPIGLSPSLLIAGSIFAGLLLGAFFALVSEAFDTKVVNAEQAERLSHLPLLTSTPHLAAPGETTPDADITSRIEMLKAPRSHYAETIQILRSSILLSSADRTPKVVLITSAIPGEGKSTTARNLAAAFSQHHARTLLIDCDLRLGRLSQVLNLPPSTNGLSSYLTNQAKLSDAIVPIGTDGTFFVLPAGPVPPNPTVLVSSAAMADLVAECREKFDMVILDCPPLLGITDPVLMSRFSDAMILIVRQNVSRKRAIKDVLKAMGPTRNRIIGFVLNDAPRSSFGYGYGYEGYQRYYAHPEETR